MEPQVNEWGQLIVRWAHVIFGVAWIGASFYFNWLNNNVRRAASREAEGVGGELWAIHGGHFYQVSKFINAPEQLPEILHWFKWEAYLTWLSGIALLALVYYLDADVYMVDKSVADISSTTAILIGVGTLVVGWVVYDLMCRSPLVRHGLLFSIVGFALASGAAYFLTQWLGARAAYIHVGAMLGTMMAANVFFVIIPNQRKAVDAMIAGQVPDPELGLAGARRSLHNNYITLPVLFIMISNHYPMTFAHSYNWAILIGLSFVGGLVRHWFNVRGQGGTAPWVWPVAAAGMVALVIFSAPRANPFKDTPIAFAEVRTIVEERCQTCHSATPTYSAFPVAPQGVMLDRPQEIGQYAPRINSQLSSGAMPLGNVTNMTQEERDKVMAWFAQGAKVEVVPTQPEPAPADDGGS